MNHNDIIELLKEYGFEVEFYDGYLIHATDDVMLLEANECSKGIILRYATLDTFDRWANSGCEQFFESWNLLHEYLFNNIIQLYKNCIKECVETINEDY